MNRNQHCAQKVVVLNDDDAYLHLVADLLEDTDPAVTAIVGKKADHAVELVRRERPDLVILDVVFEREQLGWRVLDDLKADPETADIPVLLCTASVRTADGHEDALKRHGVPVLVKPFDIETFLAAVRRALPKVAVQRA